MNNKKHLNTILSALAACLFLLIEGISLYILHSANLLPAKYFLLIAGFMACISIIIILLLFVHGRKSVGVFRTVVSYLLILAISGGCIFASNALNTLNDTFSAVTEQSSVFSYYGAYVLSSDPAQTAEETGSYSYGISSAFSPEHNEACLNEIAALTGSAVSSLSFGSPYEMIDALYSGEVQAVIMDNAYIDILADIEQYSDFSERTRSVFEHKIESESKPIFQFSEPDKDPTEQAFIMYLSGTDVYYDVNSKSRSDVNILAVINPETHQILLVNTPRDYYIPNPAGDGAKDKLTHLGLYGVDCSAKGLSDLYGMPVSYTARINFSGFQRLIDAVGGVTIRPEVTDSSYGWQEEITLDGYSALEFARNRGYAGGDNVRGRHQMDIIKALADKLMSSAILSSYSDIMESLQGMFVTDMPADVISDFIKMQIDEMPGWNIISFAVTGYDTSQIPYSMPGMYAYCMEPDMDSVQRASSLMQRVMDGEILSAEDLA